MADTKQAIVMRKDLDYKGHTGKVIAQGAHASLNVFLNKQYTHKYDEVLDTYRKVEPRKQDLTDAMKEWVDSDLKTKIVLAVNSKEELLDIYNQAEENNLPCSLIKDAGLTVFDEPTYTCCAVGPDKSEKVDKITGDLSLY